MKKALGIAGEIKDTISSVAPAVAKVVAPIGSLVGGAVKSALESNIEPHNLAKSLGINRKKDLGAVLGVKPIQSVAPIVNPIQPVDEVDRLTQAYKIKNNYGFKPTIGNIDLTTHKYASSTEHVNSITQIYSQVKNYDHVQMQNEFKRLNSPLADISPQISKALDTYGITPGEFIAVVRQDSQAGKSGRGARTKNPGNIGNTDDGSMINFDTWLEGSIAVIRNLAERKVN